MRRIPMLSLGGERMPMPVRAVLGATLLLLLGYVLHALFLMGGHGADTFFRKWVYDLVPIGAALLLLIRVKRDPRERLAWSLLALGLVFYVAGNIYYSVFVIDLDPQPIPSIADFLWLAQYPVTYLGLILVLRSRTTAITFSMSLDGIIVATAAASVSAAVIVELVLSNLGHGSVAGVATNLAYPIADMILLGLVLGALAFNRWRVEWTWMLLAVSFMVFTLTDSIFLWKTAAGTYTPGTIIDAGWLFTALGLAVAAWVPAARKGTHKTMGALSLVVPAFFGVVSLGVLLWDHFHRVNTLALVLAAISVFTVIGRMALAFAENTRQSQRETARLNEQNDGLRKLDRFKDEFVALVSHELRTPLTSIRGYVELLVSGEVGAITEEQDTYLRVVDRNAGRLFHLVEDLLFVAAAYSGKLELKPTEVDVSRLAREAVEGFRPTTEPRQMNLTLAVPATCVMQADGLRLAQLLDNLLSNAIKFTPDGGDVSLTIDTAGDGLVIAVRDTGMGMRPDELEHLFDRFFRTEAATAGAMPGTGLGLSISKAIVELHGGDIRAESVEGAGTCFFVSLPGPCRFQRPAEHALAS
jgi:signal transduction histidine kinase